MIHLLDRVYLEFDINLSPSKECLVISNNPNLPVALCAQAGKLVDYVFDLESLIGEGKRFSNFHQFAEELAGRGELTIFADTKAFSNLLAHWFTFIFERIDPEWSYYLYRSLLFKFTLFHKNLLNSFASEKCLEFQVSRDDWVKLINDCQIDLRLRQDFLTRHAHLLSVEYLLATYLYNGTYKNELKARISILLKKDLEKYLYELKEILCVHLLSESFTDQLGLSKSYDFSNFEEILKDESPLVKVFFDPRIWRYPEMQIPTSGRTINFEQITDDDIKFMTAFNEVAAGEWGEEGIYKFVKSDVNKLQFIKYLKDFTDYGLQHILDVESSFTNAAGSFFSIDLVTVNHYFINYILRANNQGEKDQLRPFVI